MRIIVDGYNVLKKIYHDALISEEKKAAFINQLHYYGKKQGHEITVIFDGGMFSYPERQKHKDVTVIYAGAERTADDYIKELIQFKKGQQLLVSSDRKLCSEVEEHEIVSIDAHLFYTIVQERLHLQRDQEPRTETRKITKDENMELDVLMKEASKEIPQKIIDREIVEEQPKKMTKMEKKLFNIIKKL